MSVCIRVTRVVTFRRTPRISSHSLPETTCGFRFLLSEYFLLSYLQYHTFLVMVSSSDLCLRSSGDLLTRDPTVPFLLGESPTIKER